MATLNSGLDVGKNFEIISVMTIGVSKAANDTQGTTQVAHGLGYKPAYLAYWTSNAAATTYYPLPYLGINTTNGTVNIKADIVSDTDTINCWLITPVSSSLYSTAYPNATFYVYLLRQPVEVTS